MKKEVISQPLISVIIPFYNEESNVENSISKVLKQTFQDFEIVVVNDGSTDSTGKLLLKIAKQNERVKFYFQDNGGAGAARNKGIEMSTGKYLYFLDADDNIELNTLEILASCVESKDLDLLVFGYNKKILKNGKVTGEFSSKLKPQEITGNQDIQEFFPKLMEMEGNLSVWNKLFKADVIKNHNLKFPVIKRTEDMFFVIDFVSYICTLKIIENILYKHTSTYSDSKLDNDLIENHLNLYGKLFNTFSGNNTKETNDYLVKMFVSWFFFVIPANYGRYSKISTSEKLQIFKIFFKDKRFDKYLKLVSQIKTSNKTLKLALKVLRLRSPIALYSSFLVMDRSPRQLLKKLSKS